jgi:hypothetical protein
MAHYAKVKNSIVELVIVADIDFIENLEKEKDVKWIQTSYNTKNGIHYGPDGNPDGGIALRGNYAGVGYIYDEINDVFYPPKPYDTWQLNNVTWEWEPPIPYPLLDSRDYYWDESVKCWNTNDK